MAELLPHCGNPSKSIQEKVETLQPGPCILQFDMPLNKMYFNYWKERETACKVARKRFHSTAMLIHTELHQLPAQRKKLTMSHFA